MSFQNFIVFLLVSFSKFFLMPAVAARAQASVGSFGRVEFTGSLDASKDDESCSLSAAKTGPLSFKTASNLVSSTKAAQIKVVIESTVENPLNSFFVKAESPSLTYRTKNELSGKYQKVQSNKSGIGLDDENGYVVLGVDTIVVTPTSITSDLFVGVEFETESDLVAGDYRAVSTLSCFIAAR